MNNADYQTALEWDVDTWRRALLFWEKTIQKHDISGQKGLEIGARHGGLSWFFAKKYGCQMCCSDVGLPSAQARLLHEKSGLSAQIQYQTADATQLPFADGSFDFVVFKSVLGAVGRNQHPEKQRQALVEIHRVLKPGGMLFFAENLRTSLLHQFLRKYFVPWGNAWRYLTINELREWLRIFPHTEIYATGFSAAFVPKPRWLKNGAARLDATLFFLPENWRYVGYGFAQK